MHARRQAGHRLGGAAGLQRQDLCCTGHHVRRHAAGLQGGGAPSVEARRRPRECVCVCEGVGWGGGDVWSKLAPVPPLTTTPVLPAMLVPAYPTSSPIAAMDPTPTHASACPDPDLHPCHHPCPLPLMLPLHQGYMKASPPPTVPVHTPGHRRSSPPPPYLCTLQAIGGHPPPPRTCAHSRP